MLSAKRPLPTRSSVVFPIRELRADTAPLTPPLPLPQVAAPAFEAVPLLHVLLAGEERLIAAEDAGRYRDALGIMPPGGLPEAFLIVV